MHAKELFVDLYKEYAHCSRFKGPMFIVPNHHSILFQQQSSIADPVDPPLPSFLYGFHMLFNCSRPEYRLNTARWTLSNYQSINHCCLYIKTAHCGRSWGWVAIELTKDYTIFIYRFPSTHTGKTGWL